MDKHQPSKLNAVCIVGLPDNGEVKVIGYSPNGQLAHSWDGNSDFHNQLNLEQINKIYLPIIWFNDPARELSKPDIVINCINDSDIASNSLKIATKMVQSMTDKWSELPVFNHPAKIADTARNRIYELYKDLPNLYIPKAFKITPISVADVFAKAKELLGFPFLIRPCGAHQSQGLQLINSEADTKKLEIYAYNENSFYLTEFIDYKKESGLYHKCRLVIIGGKILPRHYMTGTDWLVHGNLHEEYMANNDAAKEAEENFINNFGRIIKPQALLSLLEIYERSGLDYLGFDFAIQPDGTLLIFEINAAQNSFLNLDFQVFPYMEQTRNNLISAFNECILAKTNPPFRQKLSS